MTSQARIDANRLNALLSTGPATAAGKQRTRLNGLKHGLRSEEIVLPNESRDAFDSLLTALMNEWKPPTETRRILVERAAAAAWRLKRCVRNENIRETERVRKAQAEWDDSFFPTLNRAVARLDVQPKASVALLMQSRFGLYRLDRLWTALHVALSDPDGWNSFPEHHNRLCHLMGITGENDSEILQQISELSFCLLLRAVPEEGTDELQPLNDKAAEAARARLRELCVSKVNQEHRALINAMPEYPAARDLYVDEKSAEAHPEDAIHHRYEGRLDREFRSTINQLAMLQKTGIDLLAGDEPEAPSEPKVAVVEAPSEPKETAPEPVPTPIAPTEPNAVPAQGLITKVDRDPMRTFQPVEGVEVLPFTVGRPLSIQ